MIHCKPVISGHLHMSWLLTLKFWPGRCDWSIDPGVHGSTCFSKSAGEAMSAFPWSLGRRYGCQLSALPQSYLDQLSGRAMGGYYGVKPAGTTWSSCGFRGRLLKGLLWFSRGSSWFAESARKFCTKHMGLSLVYIRTRTNWDLDGKHDWLVVWNIWIIFPYIGNVIIPIDELIFFRGVAQPPTRWSLMINKLGVHQYN